MKASELQERANLMKYLWLLVYIVYGQALYQSEWKNFKVTSSFSDTIAAAALLAQIQDLQQRYPPFFGYRLENPVLIQLAASESNYLEAAGTTVPDWSGAVAFREERRIVVKPQTPFNAHYYNEILRHEMAHLYLSEKYLPLWLEEGVAMYLSGKQLSWWDHIRMGNSVASGNIIPLSEITYLLSFGSLKAQLAYLQCLIAVQYVIEYYEQQGIRDLIQAADVQQDSDLLFQRALNVRLESFENGYIKFLKTKYRYMFVLQFEYVLLCLMVLLALFAYLRMRIRNRKILNAWKDE